MAGADPAAERLTLLEARPELERRLAARLRALAAELEASGIPKENYEAQKVAAMLLRTAVRVERWAQADQRRLASVHEAMRARSSPSAAARAVVDALEAGGPTQPDGGAA